MSDVQMLTMTFDIWSSVFSVILGIGVFVSRRYNHVQAKRGEDIPLEARIICVADCYDAMTSDRVYRKHLPQDVVRNEIAANAGTQFDKDVALAMLELMDEDSEYLLRESEQLDGAR